MMDQREVLHADKRTVRIYAGIILAVVVIGFVVVGVWVNIRTSVSETDKSVARSNCVAWVGYYTGDKNPVQACQKAENTDAIQFYARWAGHGNSVPVPSSEPTGSH